MSFRRPTRAAGPAAAAQAPAVRPLALAAQLTLLGSAFTLVGGSPAVMAQSAATAPVVRSYDIPAGALSSVLTRFSREAGVFLVGVGSTAEGRTSPGLKGDYTVPSGFAAALAGTGLEAFQQADGSYALRPAPALAPATTPTTTPQTAPAAARAGGEVTLPAVRVTANREAAPGDLPTPYAGGQVARGGRLGMLGNVDVMDTPFNITHYTAQFIEDQQAETVLDVLKNEPSIRQSAPTGNPAEASFRIRGFGLSPGALTFDGLHGMAPDTGNLSIEFAERLEVLKGPSALLYGMSPSGAVGGAVNLVPKRAGDTPLTRLTLGLELDELWKAQVDTGRRFGAR